MPRSITRRAMAPLLHSFRSHQSRWIGYVGQGDGRCAPWRDGHGVRQVCAELGVTIVKGVLSADHVHMFVAIPPQIAVSDVVRRMKGRSSHKVQREFPALKKRYWGRHFWARGYFCTTSGNVTDDVILQYIEQHGSHHPVRWRMCHPTRSCRQSPECSA